MTGQFDVDDAGTIIEKGSGKQPPYILGLPFPIIDRADPKAGAKVLWNHYYTRWYLGAIHAESSSIGFAPKALERRSDVIADFEYYDGVPEAEATPEPRELQHQRLLAVTVAPADLNGTASLSWRYRDPNTRDSTWADAPALRRVRAVSPANRSDGFLGSDMSQDDGEFFDVNEDFTWTLRDEVDQLRLVDPLALKGQGEVVWLPLGGWRTNWPDLKLLPRRTWIRSGRVSHGRR